MADIADCLALVSAGNVTLDGLERLSIDDVQLFHIYAEWETAERARLDDVQRRKAEAKRSSPRRR